MTDIEKAIEISRDTMYVAATGKYSYTPSIVENMCLQMAAWKEQQMMKDVVEAEVMYPASSSTLQIRYKLPKNTKLKYGDKVQIIIVKDEKQ